jgi:hypothetical protein
MKTKEQLQAAVFEILEVCERHEIVMFGTCNSEGIFGEITVAGKAEQDANWEARHRLTNIVEETAEGDFCVDGIGAMES